MTNTHQKVLKALATKLIGDGGSPNVFFVTEGVGTNVLAFIEGDYEAEAIRLGEQFPGPITVEDRQSGVVWENEASLRLQEEDDPDRHTAKDILALISASQYQRADITLGHRDLAWNPTSTKPDNEIAGPAKVTYRRYSDGGISVEVVRS